MVWQAGVALDTANIAPVKIRTGGGGGVDGLSLMQYGADAAVWSQTQANGGVFAVLLMLGVAVCVLLAIWI